MSVKAEPQKTSGPQECAGCGKKIQDRYLLKALDMYWHEDCLKCGCCDCRLGEVGSTLYTKGNLILCKRDYLRLFGTTGYCAACNKVIPAFEMVMRARTNVYHLECFACQQCNHRFCVGDRFFLCDNKILCEYDYEERMVFANLAYNSSNLAQIKQQARSVGNNSGAQGNNGMPKDMPNGGGLPPAPPTSLPGPPMLNGHHHPMPPHSNGMMGPLDPRPLPPMPVMSSSSSNSIVTSSSSTSSLAPLPPMSAPAGPLPPMVS